MTHSFVEAAAVVAAEEEEIQVWGDVDAVAGLPSALVQVLILGGHQDHQVVALDPP